jgi:hypothetical protein
MVGILWIFEKPIFDMVRFAAFILEADWEK